jgi:hypothetical protein
MLEINADDTPIDRTEVYLDNLTKILFSSKTILCILGIYFSSYRSKYLITELTDGKILDTNTPRIYNLLGTTQVSNSSKTGTNPPSTTYIELVNDYQKLNVVTTNFNDLLSSKGYEIAFGGDPYSGGNFRVLNSDKFPSIYDKTFFFIMARILSNKNKKDEFINSVIKGSLTTLTDPVNLKTKFEKIVNDLSDDYNLELKNEEKMFTTLKKSSEYKKLTDGIEESMYPKGKTRKFEYSTVPLTNVTRVKEQEKLITDLYKTVNLNPDNKTTYLGKIKFN